MSKKNSLLSFVKIVNILVEPWSVNRIKEYESLFSQLKTNREKVAVMILTIFFQVPKISIKSTKILSEKCHIRISDIPNSLPQNVFNCLLRLIPVLSVKKDMTYTKVALVCASSLPPSQLRYLFEVFVKYPEFHLAHSVYSILFERDPTLSTFLADNFESCENLLPYAFASFNLQPFSNEFILKVSSLFLSGKIQTTSSFFYSFCFYLNRCIFPIDFETTDYFVLTLFQKIETFFAPHSHSYLFNLVSKTLEDYPLPFISIHLFFQDFNENQIRSIFTSLIKGNGSIKSFFVLSQIVESEKMKELYSIATCTRFCTYSIMKKNIYFFKRSLEKITSLHFELRVLSKILEIASFPEFQEVTFEFLEIFKPFTATASAMSDILKIFFTRDKKLISGMISKNSETKSNVLTALYLLGNSPIVANPNFKTRFKSLAKALIPRINISDMKIKCLMPKSLSTTLSKKGLTNEELSLFFYNLTIRQIKPAPFNVDNAINIIGLFQISREELGYTVKESPPVPPNAFDNINPNQNAAENKNEINNNTDQISIEKNNEENNKNNEKINEVENIPESDTSQISKFAFQSAIVYSIKPTLKKTQKKVINLKFYSTSVSDIQPISKEIQTKPSNYEIQSFIENIEPSIPNNQEKLLNLALQSSTISHIDPISNENQKKSFNLSIQSTDISSIEPAPQQPKNKTSNLILQTTVVSNMKPIQQLTDKKFTHLSFQSTIVSDIEPISKDEQKKTEKFIIQSSLIASTDSKSNLIIASFVPEKSSTEIQLENLYNTSTQSNLMKPQLKISESPSIIEKISSTMKNNLDICYDLSNTLEFNMLSDDNLSQEIFEDEELIKAPNNLQQKSKTNQNQSKVQSNKNPKQTKIFDNKNQKQLKNSDVKKPLKISDNKNQKQLKNSDNKNVKNNELAKSHSYSLAKTIENSKEKPIKQKSQPKLPNPPSDSNIDQSIAINYDKDTKTNMRRPKSMNNIASEGEEVLNISSDDIGFALPSDDYDFNESKSSYSISGLSDLDENELNQMFGDDEQVQMFADMLLPPDK